MDIKKLSKEFAVSVQITAADVHTIQSLGYKSIVCHRPDGESPDQTNFDEIESVALKLDIEAIYQPVVSGKVNAEDVTKFKEIMNTAQFPMLAYCRTGTRCTELWSRAKLGELSASDILRATKAAGYDMSGVLEASKRT